MEAAAFQTTCKGSCRVAGPFSAYKHVHGKISTVVMGKGLGKESGLRYLDERGEDVCDVALVRLDVLLEEGVEVEQQQLVHANCARDDGDDAQPRLKALGAAIEACEQALDKRLRRHGGHKSWRHRSRRPSVGVERIEATAERAAH